MTKKKRTKTSKIYEEKHEMLTPDFQFPLRVNIVYRNALDLQYGVLFTDTYGNVKSTEWLWDFTCFNETNEEKIQQCIVTMEAEINERIQYDIRVAANKRHMKERDIQRRVSRLFNMY